MIRIALFLLPTAAAAHDVGAPHAHPHVMGAPEVGALLILAAGAWVLLRGRR